MSLGMEERRFLDLDHICDQIIDDSDRNMFNEAIRCYQIGSHRAAVILAWSVTADCLFRRIGDLAAENDGGAQAAKTALHAVENTAVSKRYSLCRPINAILLASTMKNAYGLQETRAQNALTLLGWSHQQRQFGTYFIFVLR